MTHPGFGEVAFVDVETTGLHPFIHEIWEVGLITPDGKERRWFLPPERLADADPMSLEVGGFHRRHPQGHEFVWEEHLGNADFEDRGLVESAEIFAVEFAALTHGLHLAAACVSFDALRLEVVLRGNNEIPAWHYHLIDVEVLVAGCLSAKADVIVDTMERGALRLAARPPWNSTDLSQAIGVEPGNFERHTAVGDCRWAKALYERVIRPS